VPTHPPHHHAGTWQALNSGGRKTPYPTKLERFGSKERAGGVLCNPPGQGPAARPTSLIPNALTFSAPDGSDCQLAENVRGGKHLT